MASKIDTIRIVFLGTGGGTPSGERNVSAVAVALDGEVLLLDCGEGTQHQILRSDIRSGALRAIFISHLHGDHLYGLPGLLASLSLNGRTEPLTVLGPRGILAFLEAVIATTSLHIRFPLQIVEEDRWDAGGYSVVFAPLDHSIPCFGYCIIEADGPGEFDVARADALRIPPGPLYGRLQRGEDIEWGGRVIRSRDVVGAPRPGRRVAYCTDTRPAAAAIELARGADVLIHEATYGSEMAEEARRRKHSTAAEAAEVAREAGARSLILTHFSPRYGDVAPLVDEARAIFPNVQAASDFASVHVRRAPMLHSD
jgi:ribonuclease Z